MDAYEAAEVKATDVVRTVAQSTVNELGRFSIEMTDKHLVMSTVFTVGQLRIARKGIERLSHELPHLYAATIGSDIDKERTARLIMDQLGRFAQAVSNDHVNLNVDEFSERVQMGLDLALFELDRSVGSPKSKQSGDRATMTYQATVVNVMIASPSDVAEERQIIREIIEEWNIVDAEHQNLVLLPIGWESHASPAMGAAPQEIINKQLLEKCALLVAVFWTRLGSPTSVAPSGTVEEITRHLDAGKPAMIYFSNAAIPPSKLDDDQYRAVVEFKLECEGKGFVGEYSSIDEFRPKFLRHLRQTVFREFIGQSGPRDAETSRETVLRSGPPSLSHEATQLLVEASDDKDGVVLCSRMTQGLLLRTNNKPLVETGNPRSEATWEGAVHELASLGLLEERGQKGEVFRVTREGYKFAERLKAKGENRIV